MLDEVVRSKLDVLLQRLLANAITQYHQRHDSEPEYSALYSMLLRLLTAKILHDRQYPGDWLHGLPREVIGP
ncbi:MAG: hypothetical protein M1596_04930 [Firmicutes bacterium]|nr:hypothetical protein [Bacillota bacterium]